MNHISVIVHQIARYLIQFVFRDFETFITNCYMSISEHYLLVQLICLVLLQLGQFVLRILIYDILEPIMMYLVLGFKEKPLWKHLRHLRHQKCTFVVGWQGIVIK